MKKFRTAASVIAGLMATLLLATSAQAIPYFNGTSGFGFDNSSLMLSADYIISTSTTFTGVDVDILVDEVANETFGESIDRTITWTLINNTGISEFLVLFTALGATPPDYSGDTIDIDIDGVDPMQIMEYGPYAFAGYQLSIADFKLVDGRLEATRTFGYTVDAPLQGGVPPALGIAFTSEFVVPEPATGLLLSSALLLMVAAGGRRGTQ